MRREVRMERERIGILKGRDEWERYIDRERHLVYG
jgi:hypothetical protein